VKKPDGEVKKGKHKGRLLSTSLRTKTGLLPRGKKYSHILVGKAGRKEEGGGGEKKFGAKGGLGEKGHREGNNKELST